MDKISLIKNKISKSSSNTVLNSFKDHILYEIYGHLDYNEIVSISITKLISMKNDYIKSKVDKKISVYSKEFYTIRGWSETDAINKVFELQKVNSLKFAKKRKQNPDKYNYIKSPMTTEFWINKGYTYEQALLKIDSQRPCSINYWLNKGLSLSDAKIKLIEHQSNASKVFSKKRKSNPERYNDIYSNQIRYWLKKGYSEEDAIKKVRERQTTFTLDKCIQKWGEEEGIKIFNKRQTKWKKSLQKNFEIEGDGRSPSSKFANEIITHLCEYLKIEKPKKEKFIKCKLTGKAYSYDFTYKKKIIEFNGDYWHCNPNLYEASFFNKNKSLTAEDIWDYDKVKNELAQQHGYQVLVIWESDWINNPKQTIEKCIQFLNN